eukprot:gene16608-19728_t
MALRGSTAEAGMVISFAFALKIDVGSARRGQRHGEEAPGIGESTSEMVENERGGHAYTIICNTATTLYIISKENLLNQTASHILQAFRDAQKVKLNFRVQRTEFLKESQVTSPAPEGMPFFKKLPPKVMIELISALKGSKIRAGEVVFNQGDQGDAMFIIVSGACSVHLQMEAEDKEKEKEKTVQQRQPRMSKQETETRSRSTTLGGDPQEVRRTLRGAASRRDPSQLTAVEAAERLEALKLKVATEYPQGDPPPADQLEAFYTRLESAASQIYGKCVNRLQRGTSFGELALIKRSPRAATILAIDECILIKIEKGAYDRTLRVVQQREMEEKIAFLRTIPALQLMRRGELQRFVHYIKVKTMPRNEVVVQQGELGTALYLIYEGEVRVLRKTANPVRAHSLQVLEPGAKPCMQKLELATM